MKKAPRRSRKPKPAPGLSKDLTLALAAAADKKAADVLILDLRKASAFTDFFVICTGTSTRQVQTIAQSIQDVLAKNGVKAAIVEGLSRGEWVLLDYFDFIVHVFTPATREFYGLERLWGDADRIEIPA